MSDIKLFRVTAGTATELRGDASDLEKPPQSLIDDDIAVGLRRSGQLVNRCAPARRRSVAGRT